MKGEQTIKSGARTDAITFAHWWEEGDGASALSAVLDGFERSHPGVDVRPLGLTNLSMEVKSDILRERPPDIWSEWPGASIGPYYESDVIAELTPQWESTGLNDACYDAPRRAAERDGFYAVPLNIHRVNNLFYDIGQVAEAGIDPESIGSVRELLSVLDQFEDADGCGFMLPLKDPWTALQLWETLLLGLCGPEGYGHVTNGSPSRYGKEITDSFALLESLAEYGPDDALFTSLTDASGRFQSGTGTFYHQGDWVAGALAATDALTFGEDWDSVTFPGTDGIYDVVMDSIVVSADAIDRPDVRSFVEYIASPEALRRFNAEKGSIPPRSDVRIDDAHPFVRHQQRDFDRVDDQVLSITHGLAVEPAELIELKTTMARFLSTWDVDECSRNVIETLSGPV